MNKPFFSLGVLILSLTFAFFFVRPMYTNVQDHRADIENLDQTSARADMIKRLIRDTTESLSGVTQEEKDRFAVFLPESFDEIRFANNLQHIGNGRGLFLEEIRVNTSAGTGAQSAKQGSSGGSRVVPTLVTNTLSLDRATAELRAADNATSSAGMSALSDKKIRAIRSSFSVVSSYSVFLLLLDDLEKSLNMMNIVSLSLAPAPAEAGVDSTAAPRYRFTIELETYILK